MRNINHYYISDDTLLLLDSLKYYSSNTVLEIGAGSGVILSQLIQTNKNVIGTDIVQSPINNVKKLKKTYYNKNIEMIYSSSASAFREEIFDLIVFNPPYLPSTNTEDFTIDGGPSGIEVTKFWFQESARCLKSNGAILFICSSLSDLNNLFRFIEDLGFNVKVIASKKLFFERLHVVEARIK